MTTTTNTLYRSGGADTLKGVATSLVGRVCGVLDKPHACPSASRLSCGVWECGKPVDLRCGCGIIRAILAGTINKAHGACEFRASNCILSTLNRLFVFCLFPARISKHRVGLVFKRGAIWP
jgi:hypothetical protein